MSVSTPDPGRFWDSVTADAVPLDEAQNLITAVIPSEHIRGRAVLDCGCGAGDYSASFVRMGADQVIGFDLSLGSLERAQSKAPQVGFCAASLSALPFPAESFDLLWVWGVLHYVPDPFRALSELHRVARPGALVVIHTLRQGLWFQVETGMARLLSRTPAKMQQPMISATEGLIRLLLRSALKKKGTTKTLRQKIHERFFVPGTIKAFHPALLESGLGNQWQLQESHPPVSDLLKRNLSLTMVGRKR
ncbi:MAG: class I SAM-dependent methyltransferase [Anaerolinea sp.]|nr:class I SAM-dependent methyltransferase [Anaerolinea sp.]